jgi:tetratricopeptide (TPR) repeat protein
MLFCVVAMKYLMLGSYSTHKRAHTGTGTTQHNMKQHIMWLAARLPTMEICIQPLDPSRLPTGLVSVISSADFFQNYLPEADCYDEHIRPKAKKFYEWLGEGGTPMPQDKPNKANKPFLLGFLAVLHRTAGVAMRENDLEQLRILAHQAAEMEFFGNFQTGIAAAAIQQRKARNFPLAIDFYSRALQIREDDHLLFNAARVHYEMKNTAAATECLTKALALNPELTVARQFLDFLAASSPA